MKTDYLKNLCEPLTRFVFLDDEGLTEACEIIGITDNRFLVRTKNIQGYLQKRRGYFSGRNGIGIVRFEGLLEKVTSAAHEQSGVYWLSPDLKKCEVTNRRLFNRFQLKFVIPIYFKSDGELIKASLVNISEGGLRMTAERRLSSSVNYSLEVMLPCGSESIKLKTDGVVVYCEPETNPHYFVTGVSFVAPKFEAVEQRLDYQRQLFDLGIFLKKHTDYFDLI